MKTFKINPIFYLIFIGLMPMYITAQAQTIKSNVKHPEWSYDKTIYEINIRQYSEEGTFKAVAEDLPRLKELGVGILWLMPIHPIGEKNRKGTLGSYYSVKDYLDVNPEFGSKQDFKNLVDKIHEHGMYVIIDWVANHTAWDNEMIEKHPEWFTKDSLGNFVPPVADWHDVVDLNFDNKELHRYMTDALKYWVKEFDIDGYRCDIASMVPTEFWNNAKKELDEIKPVFMLAESESPDMHEHAFDMTYASDLHKIFNAIAKQEKNVNAIREYYEDEEQKFPREGFRMLFTSNHDENTWNGTVFERLGNAAETFAALSFVLPGMPLIYNGQEAGLDKRLEFFEKDPIEWKEHKFFDIYKQLVSLKKNNPSLWCGEKGGNFIEINTDNTNSIFAFIRAKDDNKVLSIFNLSPSAQEINLNGESIAGDYSNLFSTEKKSIKNNDIFSLQPWEYLIFISAD
jgi:cyclomaltodextrinase / maltogenic alpha-amylase / neopullulanase